MERRCVTRTLARRSCGMARPTSTCTYARDHPIWRDCVLPETVSYQTLLFTAFHSTPSILIKESLHSKTLFLNASQRPLAKPLGKTLAKAFAHAQACHRATEGQGNLKTAWGSSPLLFIKVSAGRRCQVQVWSERHPLKTKLRPKKTITKKNTVREAKAQEAVAIASARDA